MRKILTNPFFIPIYCSVWILFHVLGFALIHNYGKVDGVYVNLFFIGLLGIGVGYLELSRK